MARSSISGYPTPHVAVDVAVLTLLPDARLDGSSGLGVLLHRRTGDQPGQWALPGRFVRTDERLADAVAVALQEKCGISRRDLRSAVPRQLHVFDDPERDDRGWVMSVAHLVGLPHSVVMPLVAQRADLRLVPVVDGRVRIPGQRRLPYGQDEIVSFAIDELRDSYRKEPDPERLREGEAFTLAELLAVHRAVLGEAWQVDTFRRRMLPMLEDTGQVSEGRRGRPAAIYRVAAQ